MTILKKEKLMANFEYKDSELPQVVKGISYPLNPSNNHSQTDITYYEVGDWNLSDLPEEDGDVEYARKAALTWIAWYKHLKAEKDNA